MTDLWEPAVIDLERVFAELEESDESAGLAYRRIFELSTASAVAFVRTDTRLRGLRIELNNQAHGFGSLERVRGLRIDLGSSDADAASLTIEQVRSEDAQLFRVVAEDLLIFIRDDRGYESRALTTRLAKWRSFFQRSAEGLTSEQQLGLFGELYVLDGVIGRTIGQAAGTHTWHGPASAVHDFSASNWALEVKATSAPKSSKVTISSEQQLDPAALSPLFLVYLGFDVRPHNAGITLPTLVARVRKLIAHSAAAAATFEDSLIDVGYLDVQARQYGAHYLLNKEEYFSVSQSFPSIRPDLVPAATSKIKYELNVDQCQEWRVSESQVCQAISQESNA